MLRIAPVSSFILSVGEEWRRVVEDPAVRPYRPQGDRPPSDPVTWPIYRDLWARIDGTAWTQDLSGGTSSRKANALVSTPVIRPNVLCCRSGPFIFTSNGVVV